MQVALGATGQWQFLVFLPAFLLLSANSAMPNKHERGEQRTVLKFLVKSGLTPTQCWQRIQEVHGNDSISKSTVALWHQHFTAGEVSTTDKKRSGRPRTACTPTQIDAVSTHINNNQCQTVREIAQDLGMSKTSVHSIMKKELQLSKLSPKFIPKDLTAEQKRAWIAFCEQNLAWLREREDLLDLIIIGDETWVSVFELLRKEQSKEWLPQGSDAAQPRKARPQRSEKKAIFTVFFDSSGIVYSEFSPPGATVSSESYCEVLNTLKDRIRCKRRHLWQVGGDGWCNFWLHHDNAPSHTAVSTLALIGSSNILILSHPPYSPDLAPCDYFLFPTLINLLRGHRFHSLNDMKTGVARALKSIDPAEMAAAIHAMPIRWMKCVKAEGEYFEGWHLSIDPETDHRLIMFLQGSEDEETDSQEEPNASSDSDSEDD